jgi:hypothetical protein
MGINRLVIHKYIVLFLYTSCIFNNFNIKISGPAPSGSWKTHTFLINRFQLMKDRKVSAL